ncbi:type II secretion system protein E [Escherichia coli]|nr:type II secretion system protein E [Escherichia coli]
MEGEVEGAIHTSVTADRSSEEDINLAWLRGRRAMLRLDPDAVYIGEIRDHDRPWPPSTLPNPATSC